MAPAEQVAKGLASLMVATWLDAHKPTPSSGQIVEIAAGHLTAALTEYRNDIAKATANEIDLRKAERTL